MKIGEASHKRFNDPVFKQRFIEKMREVNKNPERNLKISKAQKEYWATNDHSERNLNLSKSLKLYWANRHLTEPKKVKIVPKKAPKTVQKIKHVLPTLKEIPIPQIIIPSQISAPKMMILKRKLPPLGRHYVTHPRKIREKPIEEQPEIEVYQLRFNSSKHKETALK